MAPCANTIVIHGACADGEIELLSGLVGRHEAVLRALLTTAAPLLALDNGTAS